MPSVVITGNTRRRFIVVSADEVSDSIPLPEREDLPEPNKEELSLITKTVDKLTVDLELGVFHDTYREKKRP